MKIVLKDVSRDLTAQESIRSGKIVVRYVDANGYAQYKEFKNAGPAIKSFYKTSIPIGGYSHWATTIARDGVIMVEKGKGNIAEFCVNMREDAKRRHGVIEAPPLPEDAREHVILAYWYAEHALTQMEDLSIKDGALREYLVEAIAQLTEILAPGEDGVQICPACGLGVMQILSNARGVRWDCDNGCGEFILDDEYKLE